EQDVRRLLRELVEDARADGAWYVEPALYAPAHRERFGFDEEVVVLVIDGLRAAGAELGVEVGLMIAGDRMVDPAECEAQARIAARYAGAGVVSFGLASDERGHPPEPFAAAVPRARAPAGSGPGAAPASTSAPPRTPPSASTRAPPSTRCRTSSPPASAAVSTPMTRSCSAAACWRSTRCAGRRWRSTTRLSPRPRPPPSRPRERRPGWSSDAWRRSVSGSRKMST